LGVFVKQCRLSRFRIKVNAKHSHYRPGENLRVPGGWGSQISRQSANYGGKPYAPAAFTPHEIFLVPISVRGWVNSMDIVQPVWLWELKISMISSGIESAPFRHIVQCLNQLCHRLSLVSNRKCNTNLTPNI